MFVEQLRDNSKSGISQGASHFLLRQLDVFTGKLRRDLDRQIDRRLVRTFYDLLVVILMFQERHMGLL